MVRIIAISILFSALTQFINSCATTTPKNHNLVKLGNEYAKDGLLREAVETYRKAINMDPNDRVARRNLGIVLVKAGSYEDASAQFEKVIGSFENDYEVNFYLAEAYRANKKYAEAIYRYKKALTIKPNNTKAQKALAWSYFKIRYYSQALDLAVKLKKAEPKDPQVAIILSRTLLKLNKKTAALKILNRSKSYAKEESLPYFQSVEGDILLAMGKCSTAIGVYREALKVQPLLAGALLGLGQCHLEVGQVSQAITYMERAVRIKPDLIDALYLLGKAYENTSPQKSMKFYKKFRQQASKDPEFLDQVSEAKLRMGRLQKLQQKRSM